MGFLHWYTVRRSFSSGIWWYKPFLRIWLSNKVIHRKQNTLSQHIVKLLGFTGVKRPYVEIYNDTDCYKKLSVQYAHICYKIVVCDFSAKTPYVQLTAFSRLKVVRSRSVMAILPGNSVWRLNAVTPYLNIGLYHSPTGPVCDVTADIVRRWLVIRIQHGGHHFRFWCQSFYILVVGQHRTM